MKSIISVLYLVFALSMSGQGTLVVDQQSANRSDVHSTTLMNNTGQSFTPTFPSVDFIQLTVVDDSSPTNGAQVFVNLRSGSISGAIIGTTAAVSAPTNIAGGEFSTYFFPAAVALTPGTQYFFEPIDRLGQDVLSVGVGTFNYTGGTMFANGGPTPSVDLWFTEGIVVPEPGTIGLLVVGSGLMVWTARRRRRGVPERA
jgi:hypothetical protein